METQLKKQNEAFPFHLNLGSKSTDKDLAILNRLVEFDFGDEGKIDLMGFISDEGRLEFEIAGMFKSESSRDKIGHLIARYTKPGIFIKLWPDHNCIPAMIKEALSNPIYPAQAILGTKLNDQAIIVQQINDPILIDLDKIQTQPFSGKGDDQEISYVTRSTTLMPVEDICDGYGNFVAYANNIINSNKKYQWFRDVFHPHPSNETIRFSSKKSCHRVKILIVACGATVRIEREFKWRRNRGWRNDGSISSINMESEGKGGTIFNPGVYKNPLRKSRRVTLTVKPHKNLYEYTTAYQWPHIHYLIGFGKCKNDQDCN